MTADERIIATFNGAYHNGLTAALAAVRAEVLEEAARVADAHRLPLGDFRAPYKIAAAIRALIPK